MRRVFVCLNIISLSKEKRVHLQNFLYRWPLYVLKCNYFIFDNDWVSGMAMGSIFAPNYANFSLCDAKNVMISKWYHCLFLVGLGYNIYWQTGKYKSVHYYIHEHTQKNMYLWFVRAQLTCPRLTHNNKRPFDFILPLALLLNHLSTACSLCPVTVESSQNRKGETWNSWP